MIPQHLRKEFEKAFCNPYEGVKYLNCDVDAKDVLERIDTHFLPRESVREEIEKLERASCTCKEGKCDCIEILLPLKRL